MFKIMKMRPKFLQVNACTSPLLTPFIPNKSDTINVSLSAWGQTYPISCIIKCCRLNQISGIENFSLRCFSSPHTVSCHKTSTVYLRCSPLHECGSPVFTFHIPVLCWDDLLGQCTGHSLHFPLQLQPCCETHCLNARSHSADCWMYICRVICVVYCPNFALHVRSHVFVAYGRVSYTL